MLNTYISTCIAGYYNGIEVSDCDLKSLGDTYGISLAKKGVKFLKTLTNTQLKTAYKSYIQDGMIIPMKEIFSFEQNTGDNEVATSSLGLKSKIRDAKAEFTCTYDRSHCFDNALTKLIRGNYDLLIHTKAGLLLTESTDGTYYKAFDVSFFDKNTFKLQSGTDPQQSKIMLQLSATGTDEFNGRKRLFTIENIGFDAYEYEGIVACDVVFDNGTAVGTADNINITVVTACAGIGIVGLDNTMFKTENNQGLTITAVTDNGNGKYHIQLSGNNTVGKTLRIYLSQGVYNSVEHPTGVLYAGSTPNIVTT